MKAKLTLLILFLFVVNAFLRAQSFRHPYSIYGMGYLYNDDFISQFSMGNIGAAWNENHSFAISNPASYSHLEFASFDIAINSYTVNIKKDTSSYTNTYSNLAYFTLGFPLYKKYGWGAVLGLKPISRIGYLDKYIFWDDADSVNYLETFDVSGGFSKFFAGVSLRFFHHLSLGLNFNYYFGNVSRIHLLEFKQSDYMSLSEEKKQNFLNPGFDAGFQFFTDWGNDYRLVLGAAYSFPVQLKAHTSTIVQTYEYGSSYFKDSIKYSEISDKALDIPESFSGGIQLKKKSHWLIELDYKTTRWSKTNGLVQLEPLKDMTEIKLGGEWTPSSEDVTNYFNRITYRLGIKYVQSYLNVGNENFNEYAFTLGGKFPVNRTLSYLNIAFESGILSSFSSSNIRDMYFKFSLGFNLVDIWFIKTKID